MATGRARLDEGVALRVLGRYREADAAIVAAVEILQVVGESERWLARCRLERIRVLWQLGEHGQARDEGRAAQHLFSELGDELGAAEVDLALAEILHHDLDLEAVAQTLERARRVFLAADRVDLAARADVVAANGLAQGGQLDGAVERYQRAAQTYEQLDESLGVATCDANLANIHVLRGELQGAVLRATRARDVYRRLGMRTYAALTEVNLAQLMLDLNRDQEALALASASREHLEAEGLAYDAAIVSANLGRALIRTGKNEEARRVLEAASTTFRGAGAAVWEAQLDIDLAVLELSEKRYAEAGARAGRARTALQDAGTPLIAAYALLVEARASEELNPPVAMGLYREAIDQGEQAAIPWLLYRARHRLALLLERAGESKEARRQAEEAIRLIEDARFSLAGDLAKTAFLADKADAFAGAVRIHLGAGDAGAAWRAVEAAKSSALVDLLAAGVDTLVAPEGTPTEAEQAWRELEALRKEYFALASGVAAQQMASTDPGASAGALLEAAAQTRDLAARHDELRQELRRQGHAELADTYRVAPLEVAALAALLKPGDRFLQLYFCDQKLLAFLVGAEGRIETAECGDAAELLRLVRQSWQLEIAELTSLGPKLRESLAPSYLASSRACLVELGARLLGPFGDALRQTKRLYISPHGLLHVLPFAALELDGEALVDLVELAVVPSGSVLRSLMQRAPRRRERSAALVCAAGSVDAPGFAAEARRVGQMLGADSHLLHGEEATVAALLEGARSARHLHIACHGEFSGVSPMSSALLLHGGERLRAADLYAARISSPLVVLSGCETGRSEARPGDELLGLLRGFFYAGADAVIASLWKVDDRVSADLICCLYEQLCRGRNAASALRHAQRRLRARHPHPYHWAAFTLFGRAGVRLPAG